MEGTIRTITIKLTVLEYKSISKEAKKRKAPPEEVIDNRLIEGKVATVPFKPSNTAFTERDMAERMALRKWHKSLATGRDRSRG